MYPMHQRSVLEMASADHDYAKIFSSPEISLHTDVSNHLEFFNERVSPYSYSVYLPDTIQEGQTETTFYDQRQGFLTSPNNDTRSVDNTTFYDVTRLNSACSFEAQYLLRGTADLTYLTPDRHERRYNGKITHQRPLKTIAKRKSRTVFNTKQILILEKIFKKKPYVSREERQVLTEMLNVSDRVIKVWFQNRRRLSGICQREMEPITNCNSDSSTEEVDATLDLSYVESKIKDADEFGYVTLDDRAMKELITVVDSFLMDINLNEPVKETNVAPLVNTVKYEPISPVSITDCEDEVTYMPHWEPNEPEVSLRHLFDVQALMSV